MKNKYTKVVNQIAFKVISIKCELLSSCGTVLKEFYGKIASSLHKAIEKQAFSCTSGGKYNGEFWYSINKLEHEHNLQLAILLVCI